MKVLKFVDTHLNLYLMYEVVEIYVRMKFCFELQLPRLESGMTWVSIILENQG
jgi:hypothetical protein